MVEQCMRIKKIGLSPLCPKPINHNVGLRKGTLSEVNGTKATSTGRAALFISTGTSMSGSSGKDCLAVKAGTSGPTGRLTRYTKPHISGIRR